MDKKKTKIFVPLFIIVIVFWTLMINQLQFYIQANNVNSTEREYRTDIVNFLQSSLWDENYSSFYSYRLDNGSFGDRGLRKYTSFNMWAIRALLQYSIVMDSNSTFDNLGVEALNFILTYSQNKTNGGFYHWVERNGSLLETSDFNFNNSIYQIGTYQAWVLITLIEVYKYTQNTTYINIWGKEVADFLINNLWDTTYGGFYSSYNPFYDVMVETHKYTWYQAWPALALMEYYEVTGNISYLSYATDAINFMLNNLWDNNFKAFVNNATDDGTISPTTYFTLTDQAAAILTLSKNYNITGNSSILNNYLVPIISFVKKYLWNNFNNQFYSSCELDGTNPSSLIRPSDLSIWLYALSTILDYSNDDVLELFLIHSLTHLNSFGWEPAKKAFVRELDHQGTLFDLNKWTIEQVIPLFLFSYYLPNPNNMQFYILLAFFIGSTTVLIILYYKFKKTKELTRYKITR